MTLRMQNNYGVNIGLEVHIQLNTMTKAFSRDEVNFHSGVNENISAITLALPGTLPLANQVHVEKALKLALVLGSKVSTECYFDRKHYFYPDLPKGYQITQDNRPIAVGGTFIYDSEGKSIQIRIHHMHMEEDAGKSIHDQHPDYSLIEYNRAGTPLIELVTEPDFTSGQQVFDFLASIQKLVQYLDISDGNMEEGSMRCDCNVSVRPIDIQSLGERCEIKNVNSKRFAREAITFEAERQMELIGQGLKIEKTTMLYDALKKETRPMRKKEAENDYRYFPDPDLSPIRISPEYLDKVLKSIDVLPDQLQQDLVQKGLPLAQASMLCEIKWLGKNVLSFSEENPGLVKDFGDFVCNKLYPLIERRHSSIFDIVIRENCTALLRLIQQGHVSKSSAYQHLVPTILNQENRIDLMVLATALNLLQANTSDSLEKTISDIIENNPDKVKEYKNGKKGLIGFFIGQIKLKEGQGIDALVVTQKLKDILDQ